LNRWAENLSRILGLGKDTAEGGEMSCRPASEGPGVICKERQEQRRAQASSRLKDYATAAHNRGFKVTPSCGQPAPVTSARRGQIQDADGHGTHALCERADVNFPSSPECKPHALILSS
jgi:hypothetical protein